MSWAAVSCAMLPLNPAPKNDILSIILSSLESQLTPQFLSNKAPTRDSLTTPPPRRDFTCNVLAGNYLLK